MELHCRVPPERWCITKAEFFAFVEDVREMWMDGRFPHAEHLEHSSSTSTRFSRVRGITLWMADERCGPNLYVVNEHYVKPLTAAAGGMSYALMKHPEGLLCEVFISHAWAEGVLELGDHVRRAWPRLQRMHNLYCCLLANPQNLDMGMWLNVPPAENPFARAMQSASHVLIIPNSTVSIYTRLWCVFEAYLGSVEYKKTCIMPARPRTSHQCRVVRWTILLPNCVGLAAGMVMKLVPDKLMVRKISEALFLTSFVFTFLSFGISPLVNLLKKSLGRRCLHQNLLLLRLLHEILLLVLSCVVVPWVSFESPYFTPSEFDHYFVLLGTWLFNILRLMQINEELLEGFELERQATNLNFTTLQEASCSNPRDEARIREAIAGREQDVEIAIRILMKAGAYDDRLRLAFDSGLNVRGMGTTDLILKTGVATMLWALCACHCLAVFILQEHEIGCFQGSQSLVSLVPVKVSTVLCFSTAAFVPISTFFLERGGPERGVFAAHVWISSATWAVGIPAVCEIFEFLSRAGLWFLHLPNVEQYCPSYFVRYMLIWFPPITALGAVVFTFIGHNFWLLQKLSSKSSGLERISTDSESSSGSE